MSPLIGGSYAQSWALVLSLYINFLHFYHRFVQETILYIGNGCENPHFISWESIFVKNNLIVNSRAFGNVKNLVLEAKLACDSIVGH